MNQRHGSSVYEFGSFCLDVAEHRLLRDGQAVPLSPKLFDLLLVLVENAGHLVDKEALLREVWRDAFVEEGNLSRGISVLRKVLGKGPSNDRYIETVPKRGYRFVADVRILPGRAPNREVPPSTQWDATMTAPATRAAWWPRPSATGHMRTVLAASAAVLFIAAVTYAWFGRSRALPPMQDAALHRQVTFTGGEFTPAVSPDGTRIAYVSNDPPHRRVIVQDIADGRRVEAFRAAEAGQPRWSPDGTELMFWARGAGQDGVFVAPASGSRARRILPTPAVTCWSPDGSTIAAAQFIGQKILFFDRSAHPVGSTALHGTKGWISDLDWSSSTGRLLVVAGDADGHAAIWSVQPDGGGQSKLVVADEEISAARWGPRDESIYYIRRVAQTVSLFKALVRPAEGTAMISGPPLLSGLESDGSFGMSADAGTLVYARAPYSANLWRVETPSNPEKAPRMWPLTTGTSVVERPQVSPDGESILFNMGVESRTDIYTIPSAGGAMRQLTHLNAFSVGAVWSADGQSVAFASTEGGKRRLWLTGVSEGAPRPVSDGEMSDTFDVVWSPGPRPLYQQAGNRNFYVVDLESGQERLLIRDSSVGWVGSPIYSPDGRRIVLFWSRRAGSGLWTVDAASERATQLYTTSDPSNVVPTPIAWSNDGAIVFAVEGKRAAYRGLATPLRETLTQVRIVGVPSGGGRPSLLVRLPFEEVGGVAISADGRWLVCSVYSSRSDIWIVRNFDAAQAAFSTARALR